MDVQLGRKLGDYAGSRSYTPPCLSALIPPNLSFKTRRTRGVPPPWTPAPPPSPNPALCLRQASGPVARDAREQHFSGDRGGVIDSGRACAVVVRGSADNRVAVLGAGLQTKPLLRGNKSFG